MRIGIFLFLVVSTLIVAGPHAAEDKEEVLVGKLISTGSDTLGSLTSLWAEMLTARHPKVLVQVRAIGSAAAPTALIQGTADVGPMSRPMAPTESASFFARYGYPPTAIPVAEDALAVFVHRDNPLDAITFRDLDAIFSVTRRCGAPALLRSWGSLGLGGAWSQEPISMYGRSTASGTYSVFRRQVLCKGDFALQLQRLVGSAAVVRAVGMDRTAIGYASAGYLNANVKALRLLSSDGAKEESLSRELFLYINRAPGARLDPILQAFLTIVLSTRGQREVSKAGYRPLSAARLRSLRRELDIGDV